jgi:hypothetical protein
MARTNDAARKSPADEDDSDIELEGVDLGDDEPVEDDLAELEKVSMANVEDNDDGIADERAHEDHDEYEEARKERMELMASEAKQVSSLGPSKKANAEEQLEYLLGQSEVFAHFLAGKWSLILMPRS